jgi:hypothetical protein
MKSPVNIDVGQLARWQVSIYWLHDVERFDDLAAAASSIFAVLGHSADASEAAGRCVSTAYQFADQAERARQSGRLSNEAYHYRQAKEVLQKAAMLLDLPASVAASQANWWQQFRHKRCLAVARHLLMQHVHHASPRGALLLPSIVKTMLEIGRAHDRRDRASAIAAAERYWSLTLRAHGGRSVPYLG